MNRRELATLACRVIAVWVFAQALLYAGGAAVTGLALLTMLFRRDFDSDNLVVMGMTVLPTVGYGLVGWLLWIKAGALARRMTSDDPSPVTLPTPSAADLLSIALSLAGVFVVLGAVYAIVQYATILARGPYGIDTYRNDPGWVTQLVPHLVQAAIGFWLIFGSRGIARVIRRLRTTGYDAPPTPRNPE